MINKSNTPLISILAAVFLVMLGGIIVVITPARNSSQEQTILSLIITIVPSLIAAAFAERASRDIRNGVVAEKAKQGATAALVETGMIPPETAPETPVEPPKGP